MSTYIPYYIILHPKKGVWAKNGYRWNSREEAQAELEAHASLGANGWAVEEHGYWSDKKSDKNDDW